MSDSHDAEALSMRIRPLLAGKPPEVQSGALADLLSLLIAGYHPELRDRVLRDHVTLVRDMIPESEKEMFGDDGHPGHKQSLKVLSTKQWFKLPMKLRRRWWRETEYGSKPPSDELVRECLQAN